jgi:hypothetical protein
MQDFAGDLTRRTRFYSDTGAKRRPGEEMPLYAPPPQVRMHPLRMAMLKVGTIDAEQRRSKLRVRKILAESGGKQDEEFSGKRLVSGMTAGFLRTIPRLGNDNYDEDLAALLAPKRDANEMFADENPAQRPSPLRSRTVALPALTVDDGDSEADFDVEFASMTRRMDSALLVNKGRRAQYILDANRRPSLEASLVRTLQRDRSPFRERQLGLAVREERRKRRDQFRRVRSTTNDAPPASPGLQ